MPEPDNGEVAEPQEGEENVVENDARFDWIPVEENPVEASAVEEAPMARNEAERPRAIGWRLPRVQPPGLRVEREPDGTVLFRWRLPRVQPQEEETLGDLEDRILASRRATVAAQLRENAANLRFAESQRQIADANRRFAESQRQIADLERRRQQIAENIPQEDTPAESTETPVDIVGGAGYGFTHSLHKLLTNQEYSNIISYTFDNDGNILIVLKDKFLVAKEVCPRANWGDFSSCARQFCNYGFKTVSRKKIQRIGENELVFSNPKVKSIDDILTLERKLPQSCRQRVNSPTIDDGNRDIPNVLMQLNNQSPQSTSIDNNEAANVLASIANISDENTEDLDRRTSYLQNLNTNNEHSLKIALLIEALKNHVIDENQTNQIKQKQNELWQSLKEIELDNTKRKDILYKYMFEYLKRTIPISKLKEGTKIAKKSNFESIKRAKIHNRPTKPLTESEQKQADEEMNAAISRGQMLAQDEDTNMEDVQSPNTQLEPHSAEALKLREEVDMLLEQLKKHKASKTPHPVVEEADGEEPVEFTAEGLRRSIAEHEKLREQVAMAVEADRLQRLLREQVAMAVEEADGEEPVEFTAEGLRRSIAEHEKLREQVAMAVEADRLQRLLREQVAMAVEEAEPQEDTPAESTETLVDIVGGAGEDAPPAPKKRGRPPKSPTAAEDRKKLKEMCAKAGLPYNSKEPIERIKKRLTAPRGAAYGGFINSLHELLTNQKYSNIISWENDNDGNFLIVLKDNLLVAKELCPKANSEEGKKKTRYLSRSVQAMKDQFRSYDFNRISNRGENELVFSNPKVKSIDDILTLRGEQSRANQAARRRTRRKARLAPTRTLDEQGEPTNRPPRRAASMWPRRYPGESSSEEESADMAAMAVPRHVLLEHDEQGDLHSVGEESADMADMAVPRHVLLEHDEQGDLHSVGEESADMADMAAPRHVLLELDEQGDLHSVGEESADMDNNEAANVLASITNINDENTEDLDRRTSYLQNLNTNNEHSLKIALLIESLKNHVIDENEKNQIKQKQNELWQGLKEIPMEDEQRRGVLYKYMFEYLKRTIPQAKLNEGAKIAQSNFESIKRAKIHNRPTEPLTESEQKQADEEMNAAISRGQMLAQDEDTNMEDVQSAPTPKRMQVGVDWVLDEKEESSASQSGGVIYVDDENDKMRFECPLSLDIMEDPVIAEDGYSYEKEEIESWIKLSEDKGNPITSPITGDNMGKTLIPNTVLKDIIENSIFDRQHTNQESSQIEDENKNKGIVIQYKDSKYGFIHTFDGIDNLFFHSSQLDNQIIVGDIVSFVIKEYKGKPTATNIKLIEPAWNRKTGVIVKYNNDKQYGFIEADINGMPHIFVHISEINQLVSVGDKVSFIIGPNMAGKAVVKKR